MTVQYKTTILTIIVIIAALFAVKWLWENKDVKTFFELLLMPRVRAEISPDAPRIKLTDEQVWRLRLYEKSGSYANFARLNAIAQSESGWRQYDSKGNLLRGRDGKDWGLFQIRSSVHLATARKLGFDITTPEGNIDYALYLYSKNGTRDWVSSRSKWIKLL